MRIACVVSIVVGCLAVAFGCGPSGPSLAPTTGTITFDGKPVAGATVTFVPDAGPPGTAVTNDQGGYAIQTVGRDGAVIGRCMISVTKIDPSSVVMPVNPTPEDMREAAMANRNKSTKPKSEIPEKYGTVVGSGLTATVTSDANSNVFDFDLVE